MTGFIKAAISTVVFFYLVSCKPMIPQVRKCCPLHEGLENPDAGCTPSNLSFNVIFADTVVQPKTYDLVTGDRCENGKYRLEPEIDKDDAFNVLSSGYLEVPAQDDTLISPYNYCLESFLLEGKVQTLPLVCFPKPSEEPKWKIIYPICCLASVPFLIAVVVVYLGNSGLNDTYGKVISSHSSVLALSYTVLALVQLFGKYFNNNLCVAMAYTLQFAFVSCFFWLNLLCYHTWRRMTRKDKLRIGAKKNEKLKYFFYCLYAFGVPLCILGVTLLMDMNPAVPMTFFKPNVGLNSCWFQNDTALLPYFYGPIAVLLVLNLVYFTMTALFLHRDMKSPRKPETMGDVVIAVIKNNRKNLFIKCLILFGAMGLNWILEVISWAVGGPPHIWLLTDIINTLHGPIIFWIFVYNDVRVWRTVQMSRCGSMCKSKNQKNEQELRTLK